MTDIAQQPATEATGRPGFSDVDVDQSKLLPLEGTTPLTVYVRGATDANGKQIAEFSSSSDPNAEWFSGGMSWVSDREHALFIVFSFIAPVTGVECDLPYSPVYGPDLTSQDMCILPVRNAKVIWKFWVTFANNQRHDPKILVTPILGGADPGARSGKA